MLKHKVVVITGGLGLLGKYFVLGLLKHNATLVITDIHSQAEENFLQQIKAYSDTFYYLQMDITSKQSITSAIDTIANKYGQIDALVNNAYPRNKNYGNHFFDVTYGDFCENINLNLGGYFLTSQLFAQYFKQQGYGNIVNIASIYGVIAPKFEIYNNTPMTMPVEYAAIKSALIHLTQYMAKYFKGLHIRVNCISPGGILDQESPVFVENYQRHCLQKGMLDGQDLIGTLIFLLSDMSLYINGQNIIVDDGFTL